MFYAHSILCPIIDARNGQVYSAIYRLGAACGSAQGGYAQGGCDANALGQQGGAEGQQGHEGSPHGGRTLICVAEPAIRHVSELADAIRRLLSECRDATAARPLSGAPGCQPEAPDWRGPIIFNGDAAPKYMAYFERELAGAGNACRMAGERDLLSDAASAALVAHDMAQRGELTPPSMLLPVYLRASQAERRRNELGERR
jgi:tRNA A37 threonylcarbamoyladenosine modification protein TsaB